MRLAHDVKHDNVVSFYEWYETNNHLWLVAEMCTGEIQGSYSSMNKLVNYSSIFLFFLGGSLAALIAQDECLSEEVVWEFAIDLMKDLKYIHDSGIVVLDLTPAKV